MISPTFGEQLIYTVDVPEAPLKSHFPLKTPTPTSPKRHAEGTQGVGWVGT